MLEKINHLIVRHAGPRGMSVTLGAGGKQVLNKPAAVDLRRKSFHHLAANASSGEQPAFGTPEYIRRYIFYFFYDLKVIFKNFGPF